MNVIRCGCGPSAVRVGVAGFAGVALLLAAGCRSNNAASTPQSAPIRNSDPAVAGGAAYGPAGADPADVNMAGGYAAGPSSAPAPQGRVLDERQAGYAGQQAEQYPEAGPGSGRNDLNTRRSYPAYSGNAPKYGRFATPQSNGYDVASEAPPPLPEYGQPPVTRPNTIWTPGYWGHGPTGYYWVPGAYVQPPAVGALWTPGYWAANGGQYHFQPGYWGPHVGFYGGVPYGGGYAGTGYRGGYWKGNQFLYNQAVNQVADNLAPYSYNQPEPGASPYGRLSFNGVGGIPIVPIAAELIALHEQHQRPVRFQSDLERDASLNRAQFYAVNRGRPELYFAPDDYVVRGLPQRDWIHQRRGVGEQREFPGRGHAYGHDKKWKNGGEKDGDDKQHKQDKHGDSGKHDEGRGDRGKGHKDRGEEGDHGQGEDRGKGHHKD